MTIGRQTIKMVDASASNEAGFTLLEVLVALVILALSVTAIFGSLSRSLAQARQEELALRARSLVNALLASAKAGQPSDQNGSTASGLNWSVRVQRLPEDKGSDLRRVIVTAVVSWPDYRHVHSVSTSTQIFVVGETSK